MKHLNCLLWFITLLFQSIDKKIIGAKISVISECQLRLESPILRFKVRLVSAVMALGWFEEFGGLAEPFNF